MHWFRSLSPLVALVLLQAPALADAPAYDYGAPDAADVTEAEALDRWLAFADVGTYTPRSFETRHAVNEWLKPAPHQPAGSANIPSQFEGARYLHALSSKLTLSAFAGVPKDNPMSSQRTLYGLGLDLKAPPPYLSGNFYSIEQSIDGITDRQAIGGALRYQRPNVTLHSLFDYDTSFDELNQARLHGTWRTRFAAWNFLADRHKTPTLQASTALIGENAGSIDGMLQSLSEDEIRRRAEALTAVSKLTSVGMTRPLYGKWNLGAEVKLTHTSATAGTELLAPTPATGNVHTYTLQTNANNFFAARDGLRFEVSYIDAPFYDGQQLVQTYRSQLSPRWTLDASMRWYDQADVSRVEFESITPIVRLGHKWKDNVSWSAELGVEDSQITGPGFSDRAQREFAVLNYRRNF